LTRGCPLGNNQAELTAENGQTRKDRLRRPSLAEAKALNDLKVTLGCCPLEIIQQPPSLTHHHQHSATTGKVLAMDLQMIGQKVDPRCQDRNLHFGRSRITLFCTKLFDQLMFLLFCDGHLNSASPRPLCRSRLGFPQKGDPTSTWSAKSPIHTIQHRSSTASLTPRADSEKGVSPRKARKTSWAHPSPISRQCDSSITARP